METIGLLAAVHQELVAIRRAVELTEAHGVLFGAVGPQRVVAVVSGMGARRAEIAFDDLIATWGPDRVLHVGFAGALDPALGPGAMPKARRVRCADGGEDVALAAEGPPRRAAPVRTEEATTLVSTATLAATPEEKQRLRARTGSATVDMESHAVARRAAKHGVPLDILRAVVDTADMAVNPTITQWVDPAGRTRWPRLARDLLRHPTAFPPALQLGRHARLAGAALASAVAKTLNGTTP